MTRYLVIAQIILLGFNFFTASPVIISLAPNEPETMTSCRCRDSLTLVTFYDAMDGPNWIETWDLNTPLEEWAGVSLDNGDCVSSITLNTNNLSGEIPEEIGDLSFLKEIALGNNFIVGGLPFSLSNLGILESLNFRNNQIEGTIPREIGKLTRLNTLNLSVNALSGEIPSEVGNLRALTGLFLNRNNFTGTIPSQIGNLSDLVSINLSSNNLEGIIPNELGDLLKITGIGLNDNNLSGELPERFGQLEKLVSLRLENNNFTGPIPESFGNLMRIETIFLFNNNLSGCYPMSFTNLCGLINNTSQMGRGYNFRDNPLLPWEGDFFQYCNGGNQLGATCDDANPNTETDGINEDCSCQLMQEIIIEPIQIGLSITITGTCPDENEGAALISINPNGGDYHVAWEIPNGTVFLNETSNPTYQQTALAPGIYGVTVSDVNEEFLPMSSTIEIPELNCFELGNIPQLITPNGDGLNEAFIFEVLENNPSGFPDNELIIFNRWGDTVYTARPYQNNWAGNNQSGRKLPQGTYYYILKLDLNEGLIVKGDITVVR